MRTIQLVYEVKTANNNWNRHTLVTSDGKEYEEAVNTLHSNPDTIKVVSVEHI